MHRLLWVENALPLNTRSQRILDSLQRSGRFEIIVCAWNRSGTARAEEGLPHYRVLSTTTGHRRLARKALALPKFLDFVSLTVRDERPDLIGASFWDATLASAWAGRGLGIPIVYDVLDMPGGAGPLFTVGRTLERLALPSVSGVVLASRFFEPFYSTGDRRRLVFENLPSFPTAPPARLAPRAPPRIAYVGTIRFAETLLPLLEAVSQRGGQLDLFGGGPDAAPLQERFAAARGIVFHGPYDYRDVPAVYESIDVLWAAYPPSDVNVRYAISNKYFESLWFGVPAVFSANTALGRMVADDGTGFVVDAGSNPAVVGWLDGLLTDPAILRGVHERLAQKRAALLTSLRWETRERELVDYFADLAGGRPSARR